MHMAACGLRRGYVRETPRRHVELENCFNLPRAPSAVYQPPLPRGWEGAGGFRVCSENDWQKSERRGCLHFKYQLALSAWPSVVKDYLKLV